MLLYPSFIRNFIISCTLFLPLHALCWHWFSAFPPGGVLRVDGAHRVPEGADVDRLPSAEEKRQCADWSTGVVPAEVSADRQEAAQPRLQGRLITLLIGSQDWIHAITMARPVAVVKLANQKFPIFANFTQRFVQKSGHCDQFG